MSNKIVTSPSKETLKSKLKSETGDNRISSISTTLTNEVKRDIEPPAGAIILRKTVRTETEQIENGWLISKNFDIKYKVKGSDSSDYAYYTKKWFSKTDPLEVKLTDKALADEFDINED